MMLLARYILVIVAKWDNNFDHLLILQFYCIIKQILGSGINRHLEENPMVREVLGLGSPKSVMVDNPHFDARVAKAERQYKNSKNSKHRSVNRSRNTDHKILHNNIYIKFIS